MDELIDMYLSLPGFTNSPDGCVGIVVDILFYPLCKVIAPFKDTVPDETSVGAGLPARIECAKITGH